MAECAEQQQIRLEWHELLVGVKTTVEGLLASQSANVWSTYGGLSRLRNNVIRILNHRLKVTQGPYGSVLDYWNFIRGLRHLAPDLAPMLDQMVRLCQSSGDLSTGQTWVRQSLLNHSLSSQLITLVSSAPHLHHHYYDEAFLCQPQYVEALLICLQAVEQNRPALLAELNPTLLATNSARPPPPPPSAGHRPPRLRPTHVRSASLPVGPPSPLPYVCSDDDDMIRRRQTNDPLAPPSRSPKTNAVPIKTTTEHAMPSLDMSPKSAQDALRQVLNRSTDIIEPGEDMTCYVDKIVDPLMSVETLHHPGLGPAYGIPGLPHYTHKEQFTSQPHNQYHPLLQSQSSIRSDTSGEIRLEVGSCALDNEGHNRESLRNGNVLRHNAASIPTSYTGSSGGGGGVSRVDAILESPDHQRTNQSRLPLPSPLGPGSQGPTLSEVQRTGTIIIGDHRPRSTDSGVSSPPTNSALFVTTNLQRLDNSAPAPRRAFHARSTSDVGLFRHQQALCGEAAGPTRRRRISEDLSVSVPTDSYSNDDPDRRSSEVFFPQPSKGQSLLSFLSSQDFHTCAELDKENAHFSISEALIAAIEQMKWNQILRPQQASDDHEIGDSDEEIQVLKQRIRIRRQARLTEKARGFPAFADVKIDPTSATSTTTPTSYSGSSPNASPPLTDSSGDDNSGVDGDIHDAEISEELGNDQSTDNLISLSHSGLSLSMASLYSEVELQRANSNLESTTEKSGSTATKHNENTVSAENVAISLLKKFPEREMPKASDLVWLVSEKEAPQKLLPLPNSYPVSPDDNENDDLRQSSKMTRLRGNLEWAPPRPQIIFNIHPPPKRKVILANQNYCCAGCGAKVEPGYMKRYRYCEYLGKYFCPRCHTNALSSIPGRILGRWDFTKYYVSNFALDLLNKRSKDPLYSVEHVNASLYRKVRVLDSARECRVQLQHLRLFLQTCRNGQSMLEEFEKVPSHWTNDVHSYSMDDLVKLKKSELVPQLRRLVNDATTHVHQCQLCQAKGFICETCNSNDIIYPFELHSVVQCDACKACYHKKCYSTETCPKCIRIEARRRRLAALSPEPFSESSGDSTDEDKATR